MKRRTFLQLIGLTSAPLPVLVGADLGKALTEDETGTALIRVKTSIKPFYFKIPVTYRYSSTGTMHCDPAKKDISIEVLEDMKVEKVEVRSHTRLAEFYKSIGLERQWIDIPISPMRCPAGTSVWISFSESGLYTIT